jgi:PD-(D/E)XK nuclease superfamily protein
VAISLACDAASAMLERLLPWVVAALCALALAVLVATRALARWRSRALVRRRWTRAVVGEVEAEDLLAERGFAVVDRQAGLIWEIECDGQPHPVELRADLLVERDGRRYVAEVKTGATAPLLTHAATRRQLLEYCVAYQVDSVLLVDVEAQAVREITFRVSGGSG